MTLEVNMRFEKVKFPVIRVSKTALEQNDAQYDT